MTESEKITALRYIYGFSFRALDKRPPEKVAFRVMSAREVNRMVKERNRMARLNKSRVRY